MILIVCVWERDEEWDKGILLENICLSPKKIFRHCLWCHFLWKL